MEAACCWVDANSERISAICCRASAMLIRCELALVQVTHVRVRRALLVVSEARRGLCKSPRLVGRKPFSHVSIRISLGLSRCVLRRHQCVQERTGTWDKTIIDVIQHTRHTLVALLADRQQNSLRNEREVARSSIQHGLEVVGRAAISPGRHCHLL